MTENAMSQRLRYAKEKAKSHYECIGANIHDSDNLIYCFAANFENFEVKVRVILDEIKKDDIEKMVSSIYIFPGLKRHVWCDIKNKKEPFNIEIIDADNLKILHHPKRKDMKNKILSSINTLKLNI